MRLSRSNLILKKNLYFTYFFFLIQIHKQFSSVIVLFLYYNKLLIKYLANHAKCGFTYRRMLEISWTALVINQKNRSPRKKESPNYRRQKKKLYFGRIISDEEEKDTRENIRFLLRGKIKAGRRKNWSSSNTFMMDAKHPRKCRPE